MTPGLDKNVRAYDGFMYVTGDGFAVRYLGYVALGVIEIGTTIVNRTYTVHQNQIAGTGFDEHVRARNAGCACTGEHNFYLTQLLANNAEGIRYRRCSDDCGTVLVVVEHRDADVL